MSVSARASHSVDLAGLIIHRDEADQIDMDRYRLNWRADNTARVTRREIDTTGMMRCCRAATCRLAEFCVAGRPHAPDPEKDAGGLCYDHKPYIVGGIWVWGSACGANASHEARSKTKGES